MAKNILIIDDNRMMIDGVRDVLSYLKYSSEGVTKVNEAVLDKLKSSVFDMIILDVMLSGTDGRDLARKFKETDGIKEIPLLMISAYSDIKKSVLDAGADDFLIKPFGLDELKEKLELHLNHTP